MKITIYIKQQATNYKKLLKIKLLIRISLDHKLTLAKNFLLIMKKPHADILTGR